MAVLKRLDIVLFANTAQYRREMRETQQSTKTVFQAIKDDAVGMAKVGAAAFAGMAVAGTAAIGVMVKEQTELAGEIVKLARISNTGVVAMQKLAIAARSVGVEQDTLGDIYKDTQDKIGDFLTTGGGAMADFFDSLPPSVDLTAEAFRNLSGPESLQLYYDTLQKANLSQSEMVFYMEGIASDASLLIPLLHDGGAGFDVWATAAENAGAIMDEKTIKSTQELRAANDLLTISAEGARVQFTSAFIPVLADLSNKLVGSGSAANFARKAGDTLVIGFKGLAITGVIVGGVFEAVGKSIGGVAATISTLMDGVGIADSGLSIAIKMGRNLKAAGVINREVDQEVRASIRETAGLVAEIKALGTGTDNEYVNAVIAQNNAQDALNKSLGLTGQQVQANAKAGADAAKEAEKNAKTKAAAAKKAAKAGELIPKAVSDAIVDGARRLGINPNDLAAVISFETGGTFSTNARNPGSSATGLIQFMEDSDGKKDGKYFGMTRAQFGNLLPLQQMDHVVSFLKGKGIKPGANVAQVYDAVAGYGYKKGSKAYASNKVWDVNKDGVIAKGEAVTGKRFKAHIKDYYGDGVAYAQQSIAQIQGLEIQQARDRQAIRNEYAGHVARIENDLAAKIEKINALGFTDEERAAFVTDAQIRADIEITTYQDAQARKLEAFSDFTRDERDLIIRNAAAKAADVLRDMELSEAQQLEAIGFIKQRAAFDVAALDLSRAMEMQAANEHNQTERERVVARFAFERQQLALNLSMTAALRQANGERINAAEIAALDELRYAHENEIAELSNYGKTELQTLRDQFAQQRLALDRRTDIDDPQKAQLREAMAGAQVNAIGTLRKGAADPYNGQQAEMQGTGESYAVAQQYAARLKVIQDALDNEVIAVEQAEKDKYAARQAFEAAATQLTMMQAEQTAGSLAGSFKTMLGEQNGAYKLMFATQQAFVMASAGLNMYDAWGDAMAEGATMSTKIASALTIATQFGRIIAAASSMTLELPGFQAGGYTGNAKVDEIAGYAHGQEMIINAPMTAKYRRELDAMNRGDFDKGGQSDAPVNVNVAVTVNADGTSSVDAQSKLGAEMGQVIAAVAQKQIQKALGPGGVIYQSMR